MAARYYKKYEECEVEYEAGNIDELMILIREIDEYEGNPHDPAERLPQAPDSVLRTDGI